MNRYTETVLEFKRHLLTIVLEHYGGNRSLAAEALGTSRSDMLRLMRKINIKDRRAPGGHPPRFRCRLCRDTGLTLKWTPTHTAFVARRVRCPRCSYGQSAA